MTKTEKQPEALRLAQFFESLTKSSHRWWDGVPVHEKAATVLHAQLTELQQLKAQLITQTNRAAAAEQQVTSLTQRLDMANRLNTDAREQLAQLSGKELDGQKHQTLIDNPLANLIEQKAAAAEREACACINSEKSERLAQEAEQAAEEGDQDTCTSNRAAAHLLSVCAARIRARGTAGQPAQAQPQKDGNTKDKR